MAGETTRREERDKRNVVSPPLSVLLGQRALFLGFVQRRVGDAFQAEDILQGAYLRAMEHAGELREEESSVAWFYRILRNAIIDHYRRSASEGRVVTEWAEDLDETAAPEPELERVVCGCISAVLGNLKPEYAEVLRAVDLGEFALKDFAAAHSITSGNAGVRAHRARLALRRELLRTCGRCAEHGCLDCTCRASS